MWINCDAVPSGEGVRLSITNSIDIEANIVMMSFGDHSIIFGGAQNYNISFGDEDSHESINFVVLGRNSQGELVASEISL